MWHHTAGPSDWLVTLYVMVLSHLPLSLFLFLPFASPAFLCPSSLSWLTPQSASCSSPGTSLYNLSVFSIPLSDCLFCSSETLPPQPGFACLSWFVPGVCPSLSPAGFGNVSLLYLKNFVDVFWKGVALFMEVDLGCLWGGTKIIEKE